MSWTSCWGFDLRQPDHPSRSSQCQLVNLLAELVVTHVERIHCGLSGGIRDLKLWQVLELSEKTFSGRFYSWFFLVLGSIDENVRQKS